MPNEMESVLKELGITTVTPQAGGGWYVDDGGSHSASHRTSLLRALQRLLEIKSPGRKVKEPTGPSAIDQILIDDE